MPEQTFSTNPTAILHCNHRKKHFITSVIFASIFATASTFYIWLLFFQHITEPSFLSFTSLSDSYVLNNSRKVTDPTTLYNIGELVRDKTIISIKDLWGFQSSFYQTIITVLIAVNAFLGGIAFLVIRSSSMDKARQEGRSTAINEVQRHMGSSAFEREVKQVIQTKINPVQFDMNQQLQTFEMAAGQMEKFEEHIVSLKNEVERLSSDNSELRRHIATISKHISHNDDADSIGQDLNIGTLGSKE